MVRNGLASLASSTMKKSQTTLPLPFQNNNNTNSTSSIILPAFSKPTNNNPPSCPHMPPAELSKVKISPPPPINTVADPVTDEDFMKLFFTKNNKKAFMPATTKRALLFDLLDHMEVSKFAAKGDDLQLLESFWSKKKLSKGKRGLYPLNLVFDNLLTIDSFIHNNQCVSRLHSSHSSLRAVVDAMDNCCKKAKINREKHGQLAESLTAKETFLKHLHMKYVPDAAYSWIECPSLLYTA